MRKLIERTYSSSTYDTGVRRIKREWNEMEAKYVYRLYMQVDTFNDGFPRASRGFRYITQGDLEWATSNAEHYGIDIIDG